MIKALGTLGVGILGAIAVSEGVMAHGVKITTQMSPRVNIEARFDSGDPIAQGQVQVFSPQKPETAQFKGQTDNQGRYQFTPTESGLWEVVVRQAGHGESVSVPIDLGAAPVETMARTNAHPMTQRLITIGSVIWGCVGTALYFKGRSA